MSRVGNNDHQADIQCRAKIKIQNTIAGLQPESFLDIPIEFIHTDYDYNVVKTQTNIRELQLTK
jgi:hypothetical protein